MLFHELNNGTMDNAIEFYPKLRAAFTVCIHLCCFSYRQNNTIPGRLDTYSDWGEHDSPVCRD